MRIFLVIFSLLAIAIFAFHFQSAIYEATTEPWTRLLAAISAKLITVFDDGVWSEGVQILTDPATNSENFPGVQIVAGCNGIEAWLVLVAAIMAFPPYSYLKLRWILLGMAVIIFFPLYWDAWLWKLLTALLFVFATQIYSPIGRQKLIGVLLGFLAVQVLNIGRWQALIILDAFIVFLIWLSKLPSTEDDDDDGGNDFGGDNGEDDTQHLLSTAK